MGRLRLLDALRAMGYGIWDIGYRLEAKGERRKVKG